MPTPLGPQAPSAPVGDVEGRHHPQSRRELQRESIAKAFERARTDPPPAHRPKPGMGDNKPPEPTPREKPKQPPLDLRKRPTEAPPERARAEHGHFAARTADNRTSRQPQPGTARNHAGPGCTQPAAAACTLPRAADQADVAGAARLGHAPETVRADVHRMYREFANASRLMKADREVMNSIRQYHQLAQRHGTTLARALQNYTSMENKLEPIRLVGSTSLLTI
jgi:hypothetical protein